MKKFVTSLLLIFLLLGLTTPALAQIVPESNKGEYLYAGLNVPPNSNFHHLFLSDKRSGSLGGLVATTWPRMIVTEYDPFSAKITGTEPALTDEPSASNPTRIRRDQSLAAGSTGCEYANDDNCNVRLTDFSPGFTDKTGNYHGFSKPSDARSIYRDGNYVPRGDLIIGKELRVGLSQNIWYMCTSTIDGERINATPDSEMYACDAQGTASSPSNWRVRHDSTTVLSGQYDGRSNDWDYLEECNNGIDDDGDGIVDHVNSDFAPSSAGDIGCSSKYDDKEGSAKNCVPVLKRNTSSSGNVQFWALYDGNPVGPNNYCNGAGGNAESFAQVKSRSIFSIDSKRYICEEGKSGQPTACSNAYRDYYYHDENISESSSSTSTIPIVEYFATKKYFKQKFDSDGKYPNSKFVTSKGFDFNYMGLDNSRSTKNYPVVRKGAERIYSEGVNPHDKNFWFNTKGLVEGSTSGYAGSQLESWVYASAGVENTDSDTEKEIESTDQHPFPGGWAGNCKKGKWSYDSSAAGNWKCSSLPKSSSTITVSFFDIPKPGGKIAGIKINWTEMKEWNNQIFGVLPHGGSGYSPVQVRAQCWHGTLTQRPSGGKLMNLKSKVNYGTDTYVVGKLPNRTSTLKQKSTGLNTYSCIWGFRQRFSDVSASYVPSGVNFFKNTGSGVKKVSSGTGYIVEGTNGIGRVKYSFEQINPSALSSHTGQSTKITGDMYPNFPVSLSSFGRRDPIDVYKARY